MGASSSDVIELVRHEERSTIDEVPADSLLLAGADRPTKIGRYVVLETIGRGGMGVVCTAYDPKLDRKIALKLLRQAQGDRERQKSRRVRMLREAQALAKLSHPNVITVHDVDTFGDRLYIAMEYVEGLTISQWLRQKARTWREIVDVFVHAARGLAAAHEAGIVHRDFKPGNVLIGDDGRVRVLDFGLAKTAEDPDLVSNETDGPDAGESLRDARSKIAAVLGSATDLKLTQVGRAVGTPAYMAPEQFRSQRVGPHTDQFSFGVALYEALYGRLPFGSSADVRDLADRVTEGRVLEPPREANVPNWIHRVVIRSLLPDPGARFPSMNALIAALVDDPIRRRRRWLAGGLVVLLAAGGGAFAFGALAGPPAARCTGAQTHIKEIWDDARRRAVKGSFAATKLSYAARTAERVLTDLDTYGSKWIAAHTAVCEATNLRGEQSDALMDHRMACLDRGRAELDALVGVFEQADAEVLLEAPAATQSLASPDQCTTSQPDKGEALPADPDAVAGIRSVERRLARARAFELAGRYEDALQSATEARRDAESIGHEGTLASAYFQEGTALRRSRKGVEAAQALETTIRLAARSSRAELEARAWVFLLLIEGTLLEHVDAALAMRVAAEAAIERAGSPLELRGYLVQHLAVVYATARRWNEALAPATQAVSVWQTLRGNDHVDVASARSDRAYILTGLDRVAEAETELRAVRDVFERLYGPEHPHVASASLNLGTALRQRGEHDDAAAEFRRALAITRKVAPAGDGSLTGPLLGLAQIEAKRDLAAAREHLEEALTILEKNPKIGGSRLAIAISQLAALDLQDGRRAHARREPAAVEILERSRERYRRAAAMFQQSHGTMDEGFGRAERGRCEASRLLARTDEAIAACEAAIEPLQDNAGERAHTLFAYAAALAGAGGSRRSEAELILAGVVESPDLDAALAARAYLELATLMWSDPRRRERARHAYDSARELAAVATDSALGDEITRWSSDRR